MHGTQKAAENDRLLPVDAVRGVAMCLIGVSHISFYLINDSSRLASDLRAIGFLATPNFLLMSGLACGYQLAASPTTGTALRILDRGLFAFLVGHLLVTGSLIYLVPSGTAFEHVVITDSIGILLCLAPFLRRAPAQLLLWLGGAVYLLSSLLALAWHPASNGEILLGALLLAINDGSMPDVGWVTPTIPYLGMFLVGVGLGKLISRYRREGRSHSLDVRLAAAGGIAVGIAVILNIARHFVKPWLMLHWAPQNWSDVALTTLNVRHDAPPTLGYALFYQGSGVVLVGLLGLLAERVRQDNSLLEVARLAAVIGRASFVSYVFQQWTIDFVPVWLGFDSWLTPATAPIYLAANAALMYWVALVWGQHQGNRFMTFGLRPVSAIAISILIALNVLALQNAPSLAPAKLALFPANPHPWTPARVAGER